MDRSRGGFSTKIYLKTDQDGLPIAFDLTAGQAGDSPNFTILLELGPEARPRAVVCDKGCNAKVNRALARSLGICPIISVKRTVVCPQKRFPMALYRARARLEQAGGKPKRFKHGDLRCEKTQRNYRSIAAFAFVILLAKSVHTA